MSKRWGEPTWYFFHIFIEKISPAYYNNNSQKCIKMYKDICNHLPCPYCRDDATQYIKNNPIEKMITRDLMKTYLFNFHNFVNKKLKKSIQMPEILDKYKKPHIAKAYRFFCQEFFKPDYVSRHFSHWRRNHLKEEVDKFMKEIYQHFYI
jgi:hypothetical protein